MDSSPVVLITGGTAGLGSAAAHRFAKQGFRVVVNYNTNDDRANNLIGELVLVGNQLISKGGVHYIAIKADLACRNEVYRLVQDAASVMGRIDVVFSNGGWTKFQDMTSLDDNVNEEDWDRAFNINVKSHLWLMHAAQDQLNQTEGSFIATASLAGVSQQGSSLAYTVTKSAQIHMMKGLACMVAPRIRVNSISPGLLLTDWSERFSDDQKESHRLKTKLKRFVGVEDVAEQVYTITQSKSMTGGNIIMDAGYLL